MSLSRNERLRAGAGSFTQWLSDRAADFTHDASELEARGRQIYGQAVRKGEQVWARTPAELRQLAVAAATGQVPGAAAGMVVRRAAPAVKTAAARVREVAQDPVKRAQVINNATQQARAFGSGFADEASFGLADKTLAAVDALRDGGLGGFAQRYDAGMAQKAADDLRDDQRYGLARGAGRVAGLVADTVVAPELGGRIAMSGLTRFAPKAAEFVNSLNKSKYALDPRGLNTLAAGGGAGAGVAAQLVSDVAAQRPSSFGDYLGAGVGGALDGLATVHLGPFAGGAIGGAATTAAQGELSQHVVGADDVINSARMSAALGSIEGVGGKLWAKGLGPRATGKLGERMSLAMTVARGDGIPFNLGKKLKLEGPGHTFTDHQFKTTAPAKDYGVVEAKLGPGAELSERQLQASQQSNIDYRIDGWKYSDIGKAAALGLTPFGLEFYNSEQSPWLRR